MGIVPAPATFGGRRYCFRVGTKPRVEPQRHKAPSGTTKAQSPEWNHKGTKPRRFRKLRARATPEVENARKEHPLGGLREVTLEDDAGDALAKGCDLEVEDQAEVMARRLQIRK
jgi:hypothetical protein